MTTYHVHNDADGYRLCDGTNTLAAHRYYTEFGQAVALRIADGSISGPRVPVSLHQIIKDRILYDPDVPTFVGQSDSATRLRAFYVSQAVATQLQADEAPQPPCTLVRLPMKATIQPFNNQGARVKPKIEQAIQAILSETGFSPANKGTFTASATGHDDSILAVVLVTNDPETIEKLSKLSVGFGKEDPAPFGDDLGAVDFEVDADGLEVEAEE